MDTFDFKQLMAWVGFTSTDADKLRELKGRVAEHIPAVVNTFYAELVKNPHAHAVIDGEEQLAHLRRVLARWLEGLFSGRYDAEYFRQRSRIGRTHVRVNLPQRFMFTGMSVLRTELSRVIRGMNLPDGPDRIEALNKLLDLELAVMLETYREDYIWRIRDADKRSMQRQLDEVQHMASIGQLAASLAHEIKNPLAGISGAIQIMSTELGDEHPHAEVMRQILRQIDRLDSAVKDLLVYARPKAPERTMCDLGKSILNCLTILSEDPAMKSLVLAHDGLDRGIRTPLDRPQFEQVVSNLVLNAAQACSGAGTVRISLVQEEQHVRITITDDGPGMSADVRTRALEPFFTTKARGTGLGLPICQRIIEAHQGELAIDTTPTVGTTVSIRLPYLETPQHAVSTPV